MNPFKAFFMSLGMFSTIPVTKNSWDDRYMHLIIPSLPIVGAVIGGVWLAVSWLLVDMHIPQLLKSAVVMLLPFFLSGFLHIDGFMDTSDAVFSRRNLDEKRRILKDSNVGAFAVIALICLMIFQFCAIHIIVSEKKLMLAFILIPVLSRCVTGLALLNLKPISDKGYMAAFKANTKPKHSIFILVLLILVMVIGFFAGGGSLLVVSASVVVSAFITTVYVYKQLEGLSGDLCGCIITVSEVFGLLCLSII